MINWYVDLPSISSVTLVQPMPYDFISFFFFYQVKIWQQCDEEWITRAMIKTPSSATAIDFSPADSKERYVFLPCSPISWTIEFYMYTNPRRKMAVGFENGTIHILSNVLSDATLWRLDTVIDKG